MKFFVDTHTPYREIAVRRHNPIQIHLVVWICTMIFLIWTRRVECREKHSYFSTENKCGKAFREKYLLPKSFSLFGWTSIVFNLKRIPATANYVLFKARRCFWWRLLIRVHTYDINVLARKPDFKVWHFYCDMTCKEKKHYTTALPCRFVISFQTIITYACRKSTILVRSHVKLHFHWHFWQYFSGRRSQV